MSRINILQNVATIVFFKIVPVVGFVFVNLLLAGVWDKNTYGSYSLIVSVLFFLGPLVAFGMPELMIRKISIFSYQNRESSIATIFIQAITIIIFFSAATSLCILIIANICTANYFVELLYLAPVVALYLLASAVNRGIGYISKSQMLESIFKILISIFVFLMWSLGLLTEQNMKIIFGFSGLTVLVLVFINAKKLIGKNYIKRYKSRFYKTLIKMGYPFSIISIMQGLKNFGDLFVVGLFLGNSSVAVYSVTLQFVVILSFAQMIISVLMSRKISWSLKNKEYESLNSWLKKYRFYSLLIGCIFFVFMFFGGGFLVDLFLGQEYENVVFLFSLLGIGRLIHLYVGPVMQILMLSNHQKEAAKVTLVVGIINILLSMSLVWKFELIGAAVSGSISLGLWAIILKFKVKKLLPELI